MPSSQSSIRPEGGKQMKVSVRPQGKCPTGKPRYESPEEMRKLLDETRAIGKTIGLGRPVEQEITACEACLGFHFVRKGLIYDPDKFGPDYVEKDD